MEHSGNLINIIRVRKNKKMGTWVSVKCTAMSPWIPSGSMVFIAPSYAYDVGQAVAFQVEDRLVIHRVLKKEEQEDGKIVYQTKGDNNNIFDDQLCYEDILGKAVKLISPHTGGRVWENEDKVTTVKIILAYLSQKEGEAYGKLQNKTSLLKLSIIIQLAFIEWIKWGMGVIYTATRKYSIIEFAYLLL